MRKFFPISTSKPDSASVQAQGMLAGGTDGPGIENAGPEGAMANAQGSRRQGVPVIRKFVIVAVMVCLALSYQNNHRNFGSPKVVATR